MARFPVADIRLGECVIGVGAHLLMDINDHKSEDHLLQVDLVDGSQPLGEVRGWVNMGSPLPDMSEPLREETMTHGPHSRLIPVECLPLLIGKTRPMRDAGLKWMSQVDELLRFEDFPKGQE